MVPDIPPMLHEWAIAIEWYDHRLASIWFVHTRTSCNDLIRGQSAETFQLVYV